MCPARCVFTARFRSAKAQGSEYTDLIKEEAFSFSASSRTALLLKERRQEKEYGVSRREFGMGVRLVQEDLDRLLLSTIADRQHTVPLRCPIWSAAAHGSSFGAFFYCAFHVREPCMS